MIDIFLVRHGEAKIPWSQGRDAGLSERGHTQAASVAQELLVHESAVLVSSPQQRALETAHPLGVARKLQPAVDDRFQEVPIVNDSVRRKAWLTEVAKLTWHDVDASIVDWRNAAWDALTDLRGSAIIFTHFMLINAIVARATDDPRLVSFEPDYASVTALRLDPAGRCTLVARGRSTG